MTWQPAASLDALKLRADILHKIRCYFRDRKVLEVETPVLSTVTATDINIESLRCRYRGPGHDDGLDLYLQTSPESAMKRLLAAGYGDIYQIGKVFRDGEAGRLHNPEFTMLEWYRSDFDMPAMMDDVEGLLGQVLPDWAAARRVDYRQLFLRHLDVDPLRASIRQLKEAARMAGLDVSGLATTDEERDAWLQLLLSHVIEPQLGEYGNLFVYDYPASQAALAVVSPGDPPVAKRFELYVRGVELANGYLELVDPEEQRRRFLQDVQYRRKHGLAELSPDGFLLAALAAGLPACSGVALGLDRLVMIAAGAGSLSEVMAFPQDRI